MKTKYSFRKYVTISIICALCVVGVLAHLTTLVVSNFDRMQDKYNVGVYGPNYKEKFLVVENLDMVMGTPIANIATDERQKMFTTYPFLTKDLDSISSAITKIHNCRRPIITVTESHDLLTPLTYIIIIVTEKHTYTYTICRDEVTGAVKLKGSVFLNVEIVKDNINATNIKMMDELFNINSWTSAKRLLIDLESVNHHSECEPTKLVI